MPPNKQVRHRKTINWGYMDASQLTNKMIADDNRHTENIYQ